MRRTMLLGLASNVLLVGIIVVAIGVDPFAWFYFIE